MPARSVIYPQPFQYNAPLFQRQDCAKTMSTQSSGDRLTWVVRFAGDSGDGIQLQGQQFTLA
ncbi:MAG TPA: hypothetical protein DCR65_09650, partial [Gammaproteobacteria bacterium]|nr:hypothetical protein [Gammaproteobacteria bacterium]